MLPLSRTVLCALLAGFAVHAVAADAGKGDAVAAKASEVAGTVHKAVLRGVKAAASGVERGARAVSGVADKGARKLHAAGGAASAPAQ